MRWKVVCAGRTQRIPRYYLQSWLSFGCPAPSNLPSRAQLKLERAIRKISMEIHICGLFDKTTQQMAEEEVR